MDQAPQCPICHETTRVPVRFICFPCQTERGRPRCNSLTRVCLCCARHYLQLDRPRSKRDPSRRCLTCTATVQPRHLNAHSSYEKDFWIIQHDPKDDYECVHQPQGCEFRGSQHALEEHLREQCSWRHSSCRLCRTYFLAKDEKLHIEQCPSRTTCFECGSRIASTEVTSHMEKSHQKSICEMCMTFLPTCCLQQHKVEQCLFRRIACPNCAELFPLIDFLDHIRYEQKLIHSEITVCMERIQQCSFQLQRLLEAQSQIDSTCGMMS